MLSNAARDAYLGSREMTLRCQPVIRMSGRSRRKVKAEYSRSDSVDPTKLSVFERLGAGAMRRGHERYRREQRNGQRSDSRDTRNHGDTAEPRDNMGQRDHKFPRSQGDSRDTRDSRDQRGVPRDSRDQRDDRAPRDSYGRNRMGDRDDRFYRLEPDFRRAFEEFDKQLYLYRQQHPFPEPADNRFPPLLPPPPEILDSYGRECVPPQKLIPSSRDMRNKKIMSRHQWDEPLIRDMMLAGNDISPRRMDETLRRLPAPPHSGRREGGEEKGRVSSGGGGDGGDMWRRGRREGDDDQRSSGHGNKNEHGHGESSSGGDGRRKRRSMSPPSQLSKDVPSVKEDGSMRRNRSVSQAKDESASTNRHGGSAAGKRQDKEKDKTQTEANESIDKDGTSADEKKNTAGSQDGQKEGRTQSPAPHQPASTPRSPASSRHSQQRDSTSHGCVVPAEFELEFQSEYEREYRLCERELESERDKHRGSSERKDSPKPPSQPAPPSQQKAPDQTTATSQTAVHTGSGLVDKEVESKPMANSKGPVDEDKATPAAPLPAAHDAPLQGEGSGCDDISDDDFDSLIGEEEKMDTGDDPAANKDVSTAVVTDVYTPSVSDMPAAARVMRKPEPMASTSSGATAGSAAISDVLCCVAPTKRALDDQDRQSIEGTPFKRTRNDTSSPKRRQRCGNCEPCQREDCGVCKRCEDMGKFGGPRRLRQACYERQCLELQSAHADGKSRVKWHGWNHRRR